MKKIFTLLFFAGFLTTGFAQSRRDQNDGYRNQSSGYSKPYDNGHDRNYQPQGRDDRDYSYNKGRDNDRDRGYDKDRGNWKQKDNWDRNDGRRGNDNYDACNDVRPVQTAPRRGGSILQIILSGVIRL